MMAQYEIHNRFKESLETFESQDPHLYSLSRLKVQWHAPWWQSLSLSQPGIYMLTGGRQVGKSTSCKQLIVHALAEAHFTAEQILYLPCDEIFDANTLSTLLRQFIESVATMPFLLIIDEITFVNDWDRVIKALADEGAFRQGLCLLTGSDTLILKEAAMRFPGRRGEAAQTDFHLYPLAFREFVSIYPDDGEDLSLSKLAELFSIYLQTGGYLRAINDFVSHGQVLPATYQAYEQWIRGDFLKQGKNEHYLQALLSGLLKVMGTQISYSSLTQHIGLISKETCIDYCHLLERMDVMFNLQAFDQNKKQGFPKKARKFHFNDPFIARTLAAWLAREYQENFEINEALLVEAVVAAHCKRLGRVFYFKGDGEIDVIFQQQAKLQALEVKWTKQLRPVDLKYLKHFKEGFILTRAPHSGTIETVRSMPVYAFLSELDPSKVSPAASDDSPH